MLKRYASVTSARRCKRRDSEFDLVPQSESERGITSDRLQTQRARGIASMICESAPDSLSDRQALGRRHYGRVTHARKSYRVDTGEPLNAKRHVRHTASYHRNCWYCGGELHTDSLAGQCLPAEDVVRVGSIRWFGSNTFSRTTGTAAIADFPSFCSVFLSCEAFRATGGEAFLLV